MDRLSRFMNILECWEFTESIINIQWKWPRLIKTKINRPKLNLMRTSLAMLHFVRLLLTLRWQMLKYLNQFSIMIVSDCVCVVCFFFFSFHFLASSKWLFAVIVDKQCLSGLVTMLNAWFHIAAPNDTIQLG